MTMTDDVAASRDTASQDGRYLEVVNITKRFGPTVVLSNLSAAVARGEFVSLLGPSGCGKTTLLRLIAGLLTPELGTISVDGRDLTRVAAHRRNIGVVFQNYALFPHLTVAENVAFGLEAQGVAKAQVKDRVSQALALVRMEDFAARGVTALSGGQQQRIAVARALVVEPSLLLLDEPFSALDRNLRETMQMELRNLLRKLGITSMFVTHDQDEALVMSNRIAVMKDGAIEHFGTPGEIYRSPQSLYVMEFVGQSTRISGKVVARSQGEVSVETPHGRLSAPGDFNQGASVIIGVRPELMDFAGRGEAGFNRISVKLADSVYLGSRTTLHFAAAAPGDRVLAEIPRLPEPLAPGTDCTISWPVSDTMIFERP